MDYLPHVRDVPGLCLSERLYLSSCPGCTWALPSASFFTNVML